MRNSFWIGAVIISVISTAHARTDSAKPGPVLPVSLDVPGVLAGFVTQVYEESDTFRAQCDRLAQAQNLKVSMRLDTNIGSACRAFTIIQRKQGMLCAEIHLPLTGQMAELLGHEVEHIIEQLEHVNLRALAQVRGSGVREVQSDVFETDRAQRTGRIVAMEVLRKQGRTD